MNGSLLDLSNRVDQNIIDTVEAVTEAAGRLSIPFLIVGAAARDFLLEYACGIRAGRATGDVDFGVRVNSWNEYHRLVKELEVSAGFARDARIAHRLQSPNSLLIDVVPFGPLAGDGQTIRWPEEEDRSMNVEGYESAMSNAIDVLLRTDPRLVARTASLPALAILKIISWDDAYPRRGRDGYDLFVIMNTYMETPNIDRLSMDARDLVVEPIPPLQEIGARLLGRDMARIAGPSTAGKVAMILQRELADDGPLKLLPHLMAAAGASATPDEVLALLRAVERGFSEVNKDGSNH